MAGDLTGQSSASYLSDIMQLRNTSLELLRGNFSDFSNAWYYQDLVAHTRFLQNIFSVKEYCIE